MSPEQVVDYKDYRLEVWPYRSGYRVLIWPPTSTTNLEQIPYSRTKQGLDKLVARAKSVIGEHIKDVNGWRAAVPGSARLWR
jgi:hypothetical protein